MIDSEEDSRRCALRLGYLFIKFSESASRRGPMFCNTLSALRGDGIIFGFSPCILTNENGPLWWRGPTSRWIGIV
jgi:hypothetical protein